VQERISKEPVYMHRLALLLPLLSIGAPGCVEPSDAEPSSAKLGAAEQQIIDCQPWICGSNSPVIATYRFHELNINGLPNAEGFSVISLWQAGINYHLYVEEGRIVGRAGPLEIKDAALQDAEIRIRRGAQIFALRIAGIGTVQTFAKLGGFPRPLQTYQLDVSEILGGVPTQRWVNLCSNPPARYNQDVLGMNTFHSLVFEGERIDRDHKTISTVLDSSWFNIGCAGHALAKLAINGQTEAAHQAFGFSTSILERQTFLKMLTADYCGTGAPFTISGQPLQWADWRGYTNYVASPANLELEARWGPSGAFCLNTPRVNANPSANGLATFGDSQDLLDAIQAECGGNLPPPCAGGPTFFDGKLLVSANPI
jgi:hypothetical protein